MRNRFRLEQIQEFYITPTVTQHGMVPKWNNNTMRFDWVYSLLQLGEHHDDAYYGDLGKIAYDHSQSSHSYEPLIAKSTGYAKIVDGAWTFDNSTFLTSLSGAVLTDQTTHQTIGSTTERLTKLWSIDLTVTNTITGNIDTATKLYASKTINGVAFDGSQNITVPSDIDAGTSENVMVSNGTIWTSDSVPGRHLPVTLATDHGLSLNTQTLALGTPSSITSTSTNSVSTATHTHAITASLALIGNGSVANQILVTGSTPFAPVWTLATNIISLNALSFASTAFVKMTAEGTFGLDTTTYLSSVTVHNLLSATHGDTTTASVVRGDIITGQGATPKWTRLAFPGTPAGKLLQATAMDVDWSTYPLTIGASASVAGSNTGDVTLATDHGLSLSNQVLAMGTPSTLTPTTSNTVSTATHTHAVTVGLGWIGNGSAVNQIPLTGTTPFTPVWTTVTNLVSLNNLTYASGSFVKMTATNTFSLDTNVYVIKSGDTGLGNMTFNNNAVIDVAASVGSDVLNIGTGNADVINIGYSGSTININGTLSYQAVDNLTVKDKLITLNKGGGIDSGVSSGFEIEENSIIKGWFTTNAGRTGFELRAPATNNSAIFLLSSLDAERTYTFPNASGTVALTSNLHDAVTLATNSGLALSTQVLNMGTPSNVTSSSTNSVTTNTHTHAITAGLGFIGNGTQANEILVTGTTPFAPAWTLATNLVSLNALTFASTSFVKMSAAGTFGLDTNTYMVSGTVPTAITVTNEATDTTCFPLFVTDATGNLAPKTNTGYLFNAATGRLTIPGMLNITGGDAVTYGVLNVQLPVSIAVGAGLSTRQLADNSIIQLGNNYQAHYTGAIDSSKAGVMIRMDTRNGAGGTTYGGAAYTLFQIQTRVAGTTTSEIPFQLCAAPTGSLIISASGQLSLKYGLTTPAVIVSTLTTGTAPLTIASTTLNTNLNADLLDGQHGSYYSPTTHTHTGTTFSLLNDQWLTTYDYAGNTANLIKLSKDNIVEFGSPAGIDSLYHVLNSGFNDIVNIPVDITSPDNTQHGVGITIGGTRIFSISMLATATTALVDTPVISTPASFTCTQYKLSALNTAPASATDIGVLGEIRVVGDYIYVCSATNTWVRTALTSWTTTTTTTSTTSTSTTTTTTTV